MIIDKIVPSIPSIEMYFKFLKKFFFFKVKPAAKIIGGKMKKKNPVSEN
jgi:hypothetical protein